MAGCHWRIFSRKLGRDGTGREQACQLHIEGLMRLVPGRAAAVFAFAVAVSSWACAPTLPSEVAEPDGAFSIAVSSARATSTAVPEPTPEPEPEPEPVAASASVAKGMPTVRVREPTVGPSYPPELITAVLRRSLPGVRKCREGAPSLSAHGTLTFIIESDGRVKDAAYKNGASVVTPNKSQQCVLDAIRAMEFVPPRGRVTVTYP